MDDNEANIIRRINQHRLSVDDIYGAIVRRSSARASVSSQGSAYEADVAERLKDLDQDLSVLPLDDNVYSPTQAPQSSSSTRTNVLGLTEYDRLKLEAKNQSAVLNLRRMSGLSDFLGADDEAYKLELESNLKDLEEEIEELSDDDVEPDIKIELTTEDIENTWGGMLDTAIPASSIPPDAKPISNVVCDGISELSSALNYLEQKNKGAKTEENVQDVSKFIQQLSEKLVDNDESVEDPQVTAANDKKLALLREEAGRMEQLREEQAKNRRDRKLRDIEENAEDDNTLVVPAYENEEGGTSEPDSPDTEDENELQLIPGVSEQQTIEEEEKEKSEEQRRQEALQKKNKYRTPEEKKRREEERAERRARREEKRKLREQKRKEKEQREKERKSSSARRRKTSSRKLSRLKLSENLDSIPVNTPAPEDSFDKKDFLKAASAGRTKVVLKYIMDGGDVNVQDEHKRTALQKAALYGEMEVLDLLIQKKAKMNASDKIGDTALHWACRGGNPEVIKKLVKSGCKINAKDKLFSTPLHVAVRCGVDNVIETLVKLGADINAKDRTGDTPMHDAVRLGRFKLIKILLAAGANLRALNLQKQTPIDMVQLWYKETKSEYANTILIHLQSNMK